MKKIKTIWWQIEGSSRFDEEVNRAISDGWSMITRMVLMPKNSDGYPLLYAELEREDPEFDGLIEQED